MGEDGVEKLDRLEVYQDAAGAWRWRVVASNGKIVGASSEGYRAAADAFANAKRLMRLDDDGYVLRRAGSRKRS